LNIKDRYAEREAFLKETLHSFNADIVSLQEVVFGGLSLDELVANEGALQRHDLSAKGLPKRTFLAHEAPV